MDYCKELKRISDNLFDRNEEVLELLSKLSNIGIIAGGSVVYALNSFVPKETVGDIDVFVNNKDDFRICRELIYENFPDCELISNYYQFGINSISIIDIIILENYPPIQLILNKFVSHTELLEGFDMDYIQCGIHNNIIHKTKWCIESHEKREILRVSSNIKEGRLIKATLKNFKSIVFKIAGQRNRIPDKMVIDIEILRNSNLAFLKSNPYFGEEASKIVILTNTGYVSHIEIDKDEDINVEELHDVEYDEYGDDEYIHNPLIVHKSFTTSTYLTFECEGGLQEVIEVSSFTYKLNIKNVCDETYRIFIEDHGFFDDNALRFNDMRLTEKLLSKEENILSVTPYYKNLKYSKLRGIAHYKNYDLSNVLSIQHNYNYDVYGHKFEYRCSNIKSAKRK
jgi:hypothetical protein